jgi:formylglycine-generating enzyme required for sulfatase activity
MISWHDAMVWCNAATEWYNAKVGANYTCAYYSDPAYTTPIRTPTNKERFNTASGSEHQPYIIASFQGNMAMANCTATGFRLLTRNEWELAARYIDGINNEEDISDPGEYYPGGFARGAIAGYNKAGSTQAVTRHQVNGSNITNAAREFMPNTLCLYGMSGNLIEW